MLLNYQDKGTGQVLVLIHGLLGSLDNLNMVARGFHTSYRVISIDLRNHGSSGHLAEMSYDTLAKDVFETLDSIGIHRFHLLGHSMGGKTAMVMASQQPERIAKLIVADIAPTTYPHRHQAIFEGLNAIDLTQIKNRNDADAMLSQYVEEAGIRQFLLRNLQKTEHGFGWKMALDLIIASYPDITGFPKLTTGFNGATLFIKGSESNYIEPKHRAEVARLFPVATAKIIQGAGHWLHAEKTVIFNKLVKDFLLSD